MVSSTKTIFMTCSPRSAKVFETKFKKIVNNIFSDPTDKYLDDMMNEAPGPINFTMFLTMFGEKLNGTDPEDVIRNAFACFDDDNTGTLMSALEDVCLRKR